MKIVHVALGLALAVATPMFATTAKAHGTWLEAKDNKVWVKYGHIGDETPFPVSNVTKLTGITPNQWHVDIKPRWDKGAAYGWLTDNFTMVTTTYDGGYWFRSEEKGWMNFEEPCETCCTLKSAAHGVKYAKAILDWQSFMTKPVGQRVEIVPLRDPTNLKEGDVLPVRLYFEGKPMPVEGARYSNTTDPSVKKGKWGNVKDDKALKIKIGPAGQQVVAASYKVPGKDGGIGMAFGVTMSFTTTK